MSELLPAFLRPCQFVAGAGTIDALPEITLPEIAFIGRSNVGKSSLVNALVAQKALARTSQSPGRTQQLNFFSLDERLLLVDMPGYGYAKVSKQQKHVWDTLIRHYLCGRPTLQRTFLLIDARRGVGENDEAFMDMLDESAVNFQIVATKIDQLTDRDVGPMLHGLLAVIARHQAAHPQPLATSAEKRQGIRELQETILPFMQD